MMQNNILLYQNSATDATHLYSVSIYSIHSTYEYNYTKQCIHPKPTTHATCVLRVVVLGLILLNLSLISQIIIIEMILIQTMSFNGELKYYPLLSEKHSGKFFVPTC